MDSFQRFKSFYGSTSNPKNFLSSNRGISQIVHGEFWNVIIFKNQLFCVKNYFGMYASDDLVINLERFFREYNKTKT